MSLITPIRSLDPISLFFFFFSLIFFLTNVQLRFFILSFCKWYLCKYVEHWSCVMTRETLTSLVFPERSWRRLTDVGGVYSVHIQYNGFVSKRTKKITGLFKQTKKQKKEKHDYLQLIFDIVRSMPAAVSIPGHWVTEVDDVDSYPPGV